MRRHVYKNILLLTELIKEDLGIDLAFAWFFHALEEEKHGSCQRLGNRQRHHEWILEDGTTSRTIKLIIQTRLNSSTLRVIFNLIPPHTTMKQLK